LVGVDGDQAGIGRPAAAAEDGPQHGLTTDDVRAVIAAAGQVDEAAALALRLAALGGLRRSELAGLRWDLDGDVLTVDKSVEVDRLSLTL